MTIDPEATDESFIVVPIDLSGFKDFGEARLSPVSFNSWYSQARQAVHRKHKVVNVILCIFRGAILYTQISDTNLLQKIYISCFCCCMFRQ